MTAEQPPIVLSSRNLARLEQLLESPALKRLPAALAPVGSALLGLAVGHSIRWPAPGGRFLRMRVTSVDYPPEAAGHASR